MIALKAYYDGHSFIPFEKRIFKNRQTAIIVIDDENAPNKKNSSRGLASEYANPALIEQEEKIAAMAFSGEIQ
ncbi:MAG: hypothetical protein K6B43_03530 [Treponema sp.]|nr:hypothetical protein [Treponema sp.]